MSDISPIILIGVGFFLGILFSIGILDKMYKELMKRALSEVGRQYNRALGMIKGRSSEDKDNT